MDLDSDSSEIPPVVPLTRRFVAKRILVGVAGAAALLLVSIFTLGSALVAAIGMGIGSAIARRRGKRLTRAGSWISAVAGVGIVLLGFFGVMAARIDTRGFNKDFQHAMDSVRTHPRPPPAWLERVAPGAAARARSRNAASSPTVDAAAGIWAIGVGAMILAAVGAVAVGTVGWLATLPLAYGITGAWIGLRGGPRDGAA